MIQAYAVVDMFGPIYGRNWHAPELHGSLSFRWSGPGLRSSLLLPSLGAKHLRVTLHLARQPHLEHLEQIAVAIDDAPLRVLWTQQGSDLRLWVEIHRSDASLPSIRLDLDAPISVEPFVLQRPVGLAINRVELLSLLVQNSSDDAETTP